HIPPEQAWGCEMDARSDVYSLGSTFYYLLTGKVPFPGLAPEMMAERQIRGVPAPTRLKPTIPPELDVLVQRMGAKDPHVRIQSARDVVISLHSWLPVAEWQALGLSAEAAAKEQLEIARTAIAMPALKEPKEKPPEEPARKGGFFGFLARLF